MITIGRRGRPLLVGLATGALLVGVVATTQPAGVLPAGWAAALGASAELRAPAGPTTDPTPADTVPLSSLPVSALPAGPSSAAAGPAATSPPVTPIRAADPVADAAGTSPRTTTTRSAPTATRRPAPPAPAAAVSGSQTAQVVALTNQARAQAGCAALRVDARLTAAAQGHSADMSAHGYFAHDSQDGRSFADRITAQGYPSPGGENIAQGQQDAQEVVTAWLNSPGHRRNIEDCSFTTIGVGLAGADKYWTQDFGR